MRAPDRAADHDVSSPLDVFPGLRDLGDVLDDPVTVTDMDRRVRLWNEPAARLYGIPTEMALGEVIDELYSSMIVGLETTGAGARAATLERGSWRGRVADRPLVGSLAGHEVVIDIVLNRLDDAEGRPVGIVSIKRDITATYRMEREVSDLGSLVSATGEARSRATLAERALGVVAAITGAQYGAIVVAHGEAGRILASHNFPEAIHGVVARPWKDAPAVRAVAEVGAVVQGAVDRMPLAPDSRRAFLESGVRTLLAVGLHREDELIGVLSLGWGADGVRLPSDSMMLLVAATIARGLENARLVEEIVRRAEGERARAVRLRKLDGLTRIGGHVQTMEELADASSRLINDALEGSGTAYGILSADGGSFATSSYAGCHPSLERWLRDHGPDRRSVFRLWRTGEGAYLEAFDAATAGDGLLEVVREAGLRSHAAIPIRVDDEVVGRVEVCFERPLEELRVDRGALDEVATIASIALQNFRLRDRLIRSERRYRTMFEEAPDPIVVANPEGTIVDVNDAALRLLRAPREWLIGRRAEELVAAEPEQIAAVTSMPLGRTYTGRTIGIRRDGTRFPHEDVITAIDLGGERRFMVRIRDLTEEERLQAELIQAQKMEATGQLVSGVAHELNNPLAAILGFSQLIRRDPDLPEELRHSADLLVEEASRTRGIVQNLLDFARQRPPERHPTSIRALVDSVVALQSYSLGKGRIDVEIDIPDDLPAVPLDRGQIQQVLVNLTHNAIYAVRTGGGARIRIAATTEGAGPEARVRVTVTDDGPGVPVEDVPRLFEAFFSTKPPADGTGLGLPVSDGIVRSHGGALRYEPAAWGRGASFTFDLPVQPSPGTNGAGHPPMATRPPVAGPDATPIVDPWPPVGRRPASTDRLPVATGGTGPRVLVIDDEPSIRAYLERALRSLGYRPVVVAIGDEALRLVREGSYDVLLCDHQLPGMSGIDVWDAATAARRDLATRFVMMSGDVLNPALEAFAGSTGVALLSKPFDLETLDRTLREVLVAADARGH